jgi:hypothetical protein
MNICVAKSVQLFSAVLSCRWAWSPCWSFSQAKSSAVRRSWRTRCLILKWTRRLAMDRPGDFLGDFQSEIRTVPDLDVSCVMLFHFYSWIICVSCGRSFSLLVPCCEVCSCSRDAVRWLGSWRDLQPIRSSSQRSWGWALHPRVGRLDSSFTARPYVAIGPAMTCCRSKELRACNYSTAPSDLVTIHTAAIGDFPIEKQFFCKVLA